MERIPPKSSVTPRKVGRPSSYKPEYCDLIIELGMKGKSFTQMASTIGVLRETLTEWARTKPEFTLALKRAREASLEWWENAGQLALFADKFQATAFIFQMKNRFREDYFDQQVLTGMGGQPLTSTPPPLVINFISANKQGDNAKLIEASPR